MGAIGHKWVGTMTSKHEQVQTIVKQEGKCERAGSSADGRDRARMGGGQPTRVRAGSNTQTTAGAARPHVGKHNKHVDDVDDKDGRGDNGRDKDGGDDRPTTMIGNANAT